MWMNTQIVALDTNINIYYSPWFPRGADNAVFMAEILKDTFTGNSMEITVYTKNAEDEGSGATPGVSIGTISTGGAGGCGIGSRMRKDCQPLGGRCMSLACAQRTFQWASGG
jgi:hypothetical protein